MRRFIQYLIFLGGCTSKILYDDVSDQLISRSPAPNGYEFGGVNLQFGGVKIKKMAV